MMRIRRRQLRDSQNPFEIMTERQFKKNFRFTKDLAILIIERLEPHLRELRANGISRYLKVLATLNFLGHGTYQNGVGMSSVTAMSQTSVSRAITNVCRIISEELMPEWIQFPTTPEAVLAVKQKFFEKSNFRGVIGCIDGTHVAIVAPAITDEDHPPHTYINRKSFHSINVMLICNANCTILACDARYPGSVHDAAIWRLSNIRGHLRQRFQAGDTTSRLIGDSGYGLEPWLFTPFAVVQPNTPEEAYNNLHRATRNVIERTNGILKGRFRCLLKHRVLHYSPDRAAYIIYAAAVLHNIAIWGRLEMDEQDIVDAAEENDIPVGNNINQAGDNLLLQLGQDARRAYIRNNLH